LPPAPAPAPPRIYGVSELLKAARVTLESRFAEVRVEGEVSGLKRSGNGHIYFTLKDAEAQLDCVMYAREAGRLKFTLEEGMAVRCRGRLTIYEARGRFQMTVDKIEPTGAGALALAFEQLKQRLGAEGLFDPGRKRPLPFLPRRIGVVTSPQGAVLRDIVRVAHRRFPVPILLAPTHVQGEGAALGIAAGIRKLEAIADVDVIIVARGGGSLEDLWAFNEEPVARAIHACRVPVISAVGHETDFTIADFVADLRAPTPSAAAERAVPIRDDLTAELDLLRRRGGRALAETARRARHELERARAAPRRSAPPARVRRQRLDEHVERSRRVLARRLAVARADLRGVEVRLHRAHPHRRIAEQRHALAAMRHQLETALQPALARRRHAIEAALRQAGGAVADARARARLQPHPARRRPRRHQRRRRAARRARSPSASRRRHRRDVGATRGRGRNDPRGGARRDVSKSRSPAIHNAAFRALGVDGEYGAVSVAPAGFARASPTCARRATAT
jgi:exodeoxyribonuclease VII large subunit